MPPTPNEILDQAKSTFYANRGYMAEEGLIFIEQVNTLCIRVYFAR